VQRLETDAEATEMAIAFFVGITLCFQSSLGKESSHKTRAGLELVTGKLPAVQAQVIQN